MNEYTLKMNMSVENMQKIFGMQDVYIKKLERDFGVTIVDRNGEVVISGPETMVRKAASVLEQNSIVFERGFDTEAHSVDYAFTMRMVE